MKEELIVLKPLYKAVCRDSTRAQAQCLNYQLTSVLGPSRDPQSSAQLHPTMQSSAVPCISSPHFPDFVRGRGEVQEGTFQEVRK